MKSPFAPDLASILKTELESRIFKKLFVEKTLSKLHMRYTKHKLLLAKEKDINLLQKPFQKKYEIHI